MPILQLKRPETADLGKPVLDTGDRPRVNLGGVVNAVGRLAQAARMPEVPMELAQNGFGAVGEAVMKAGNILGALGAKRREAEEDIQVSQGDLTMKQAWAQQEKFMTENPHQPGAWRGQWDKTWEATKAQVLGQKELHQGSRQALEILANRFQGQSAINLETSAAKRTFAQAGDVVRAGVQTDWDAGNFEGVQQKLDVGMQRGYVSAEERAAKLGQIPKEMERRAKQAEADASAAARDSVLTAMQDPEKLWSLAETMAAPDAQRYFPGLDAADLLQLRGQAERLKAGQQQQAREDIRDMIVSGAATDASIELGAGKARLGAVDRAELMKFRQDYAAAAAGKQKVDWDAVAALRDEIRTFDGEALGGPEKAGPVWENLMRRAEVLGAAGAVAGEQTLGALKAILYQKHPVLERRKVSERVDTKLMDDLLDQYVKDGAFGAPTVQRKVAEQAMVDGKEATVEKFVTVPDTAVERQALKARADLMQDFTKQVEGGKLDAEDAEAVDGWLRGRLKNVKAGANTRSFLETLKGADGATADLLPPIGWQDMGAAIDAIVKPEKKDQREQPTLADPFATGELPKGTNPLDAILGKEGMDEDGLVEDLLKE